MSMATKKFIFLNNIAVTFFFFALMGLVSCQESTNKDDNDRNMSEDSVHSGLGGTRDQSAQVGGTDVKIDTGAGHAGAGAGTGGLPGDAGGTSLNTGENPAAFISEEVSGNYAEVRLSKLALQNAGSAEIKSVARILQKDHTTALNQLKNMAGKKSIDVPAEESAELKNKINELSGKKATEFDKAWCEMLMEKHDATISKYESMVKTSKDSDITSWITTTLPKLRMHHDKLMACNSKIK